MADLPEASDHTSIQQRIVAATTENVTKASTLLSFVGKAGEEIPKKGLPFRLPIIRSWMDWTE